jgi:hypothetical protein
VLTSCFLRCAHPAVQELARLLQPGYEVCVSPSISPDSRWRCLRMRRRSAHQPESRHSIPMLHVADIFPPCTLTCDAFIAAILPSWACHLPTHTYIIPPTDEKNQKMKNLIHQKMVEYLDRAEKLKTHIYNVDDKRAKQAIGSNGKGGSK